MKFFSKKLGRGFTLVELLIVITIIALLSAVVIASLNQARKQSRDKAQKSALKQMQLSLELYREAFGRYPAITTGVGANCFESSSGGHRINASTDSASCVETYIDIRETENKITPVFIPSVPTHTDSGSSNCSYKYISDSVGSEYKLVAQDCVEAGTVAPGDEFSRCPTSVPQTGACDPDANDYGTSYAVYSAGAIDW